MIRIKDEPVTKRVTVTESLRASVTETFTETSALKRHREYMREWRKTHPLTAEQKAKDIARSYANVYKRRGKLIPEPCKCGEVKVEMHHPDYTKPLEVQWLCRPCHLQLH